MDDLEALEGQLEKLLPRAARESLAAISLPVIEPGDLRQNLARLAHQVAPAYLPFATFDGSPLAIHLSPGVSLARSPVVYIASDSRAPQFVCAHFIDLPRGAWLWVGRYHRADLESFRAAIEGLADSVEGARPAPPSLWKLLAAAPEGEPSWWNPGASEITRKAWIAAEVGHPFAALREIDWMDAKKALAPLARIVGADDHPAPELIAAMLAAQVGAGRAIEREDVLRVLSAEAWLGGKKIVDGFWSSSERGLEEWSMVLKLALTQSGLLEGTPLAPLVGHPEAYSGQDMSGPERLRQVAENYAALGDHETQLGQLRNAASVSLAAGGRYPAALCDAIAQACDRVARKSTAATLARALASIDPGDA